MRSLLPIIQVSRCDVMHGHLLEMLRPVVQAVREVLIGTTAGSNILYSASSRQVAKCHNGCNSGDSSIYLVVIVSSIVQDRDIICDIMCFVIPGR